MSDVIDRLRELRVGYETQLYLVDLAQGFIGNAAKVGAAVEAAMQGGTLILRLPIEATAAVPVASEPQEKLRLADSHVAPPSDEQAGPAPDGKCTEGLEGDVPKATPPTPEPVADGTRAADRRANL